MIEQSHVAYGTPVKIFGPPEKMTPKNQQIVLGAVAHLFEAKERNLENQESLVDQNPMIDGVRDTKDPVFQTAQRSAAAADAALDALFQAYGDTGLKCRY